ncbi:MAG: TIR domain-containing protein [Pyrinomonadaceae bacterium]
MASNITPKPRVFVSTSSAGVELAYALQENLEDDAEIVLWMESFSPGTATYESLLETLKSSDFAVIAFSKDDLVRRSPRASQPDVNLIFEIGLLVATLGVDRTFLLVPKKLENLLPTDLKNVNLLKFEPQSSYTDLQSALQLPCRRIRRIINSLGVYERERSLEPSPATKKTVGPKERTSTKAVAKKTERPVANKRHQVFISYSHKDKRWLEKLRTFLAPSTQDETLFLWDDTMIKPGEEWNEKIESALAAAKIAVLLVSRHFLASRFILKQELPPLLEAARSDGLKILWVYLSAADYKRTEIAKYQAAHDIARPLEARAGPKQNEELLKVCDRINEAAQAK